MQNKINYSTMENFKNLIPLYVANRLGILILYTQTLVLLGEIYAVLGSLDPY